MAKHLQHLPKWPSLSVSETDGTCCVRGQHETYRRIKIASWLRDFLILGCGCGWLRWFMEADVSIIPLSIISVLLLFEQSSLFLCKWLFPTTTKVLFTNDQITINGRNHLTVPGISLQFRACNKHLNEAQEQRVRAKQSGQLSTLDMHKLGYRKVELIYGSNVIPIAVISDERKAARFAIALQEAYTLSQTMKPPAPTDHGTDPDDDPPLA